MKSKTDCCLDESSQTKNEALVDLKHRFFWGGVFALPVLFLEMGGHFFALNQWVSPGVSVWVQCVCSTFVVIGCGFPFFVRAISALKNGSVNMFSLIALGTGIAFVYSVVVTLFPEVLSGFYSSKAVGKRVPVYFETASLIILLTLLGQIIEIKAKENTNRALKALLALVPKTTWLITQKGDQEVSIDVVKVGDCLRIKPGAKIPVDAQVLEGESYVNESMLTGEPVPVLKMPESKVVAGTLNTNGSLVVKALKVGGETMLAHILAIVEKAQHSRAPVERVADRVSAWFVPVVIFASTITFVLWSLLAGEQAFIYGLISAISVLIIACPCAIGLATPMSIKVGVGRGAQKGILIKNAESLEALGKVTTLLVDKTGTITEGKPVVTGIDTVEGISEKDLLQLCATLEQKSEHPIALAIAKKAKQEKIALLEVEKFEAVSGKGVIGFIEGARILVGNKTWLEATDIKIEEKLQKKFQKRIKTGATVVSVAKGDRVVGIIAIEDPLKPSALKAVDSLKLLGVKVAMLTGDHKKTAHAIARKLKIESVFAQVLPKGKYEVIESFRKKGSVVAMAGDGVNDAPALAAADVGIAMDTGADVAIESASITLINGDLSRLVDAIYLSKAVRRNIKQNLFLAFFYNTLCIPIAAGALYPFFGVLFSPIFAAIAMSLSSLSVILNALRLNRT